VTDTTPKHRKPRGNVSGFWMRIFQNDLSPREEVLAIALSAVAGFALAATFALVMP